MKKNILLLFFISLVFFSCEMTYDNVKIQFNSQKNPTPIKMTTESNSLNNTKTDKLSVENDNNSIKQTPEPVDYSLKINNPVKVKYYRDGLDKFLLDTIPQKTGYLLPFYGESQYSSLMLSIVTPVKTRQVAIHLKSKKFSFLYIIKDGEGQYKITVYGNQGDLQSYKGLCSFSFVATNTLPKNSSALFLNDKILSYVKRNIGKTVGRGECWDLAQEALEKNYADWTRPYSFGRLFNPQKETVLPGDIIQMKSLVLRRVIETNVNGQKATRTTTLRYGNPDHTAIVKRVISPNVYEVYHQNADGKRYVIEGLMDLNYKVSGVLWFYRPQAGMIKWENN